MHYKEYKTILSLTNGLNIYRGCTHGCIYCDSRSKCYNMQHDFTDIEVKKNAPQILELELMKKRKPIMIGTGSMSDPYLHYEEKLLYTRECLKVISKYNCGIAIQTKSARILRDIDLLDEINKKAKTVVQVTLTTADDNLCKIIEPNVSVTSERVLILKKCQELGIKTVVWLCPFLPFINDNLENIKKLLDICSENNVYGILCFGIGLTLREGNREYFYQKLDQHFPGLKNKYIRTYKNSYEVASPNAKTLYRYLKDECKKRNIIFDNDQIFKFMKEYPKKYHQLSIFDCE